MMDNYDRTMELVNVAYDSNGKAAEQFGKYSDTLEYKLNKLTNTWEQMRLKFLNSNFLKDTVDMLNNLLKKFENINMKDILALAGVWLTLGKKAIQNFITGMQQASASLQIAFEKIILKASNGISTKLKKIKILNTDVAETELEELTAKLNVLKNKIIEVDGQQITIGARLEGLSTAQIQNMVEQYKSEFDRVQQNAFNLGYNSEEAAQYANNAATNLSGLTQDEYNAYLTFLDVQQKQQDITKKKQAISASVSALGQSLAVAFTSAVTAVVTEADPGQAFGSIFISGLTAMIPQVISVATTMGTMAAVATGGISLAVSLLVGAGTALYSYSKQLKEEAIEASYLASTVGANQKAIEDLTEQHEKLNDVYLETNDRLTELQDNYNNLETAINSYMDLNDQILLSADEQAELLSLKNDIAASAPELVDYYDSEGNAILQNSEYLKEYLELKKEELLLQQQETLKAKNDVNINEFRTAASKNEIATEQRYLFDNNKYVNKLMNKVWNDEEGPAEALSEWAEKAGVIGSQEENYAQTFMSAIKTYDEAWYNELIEGLDTKDGVVDAQDFLEAYREQFTNLGDADEKKNALSLEYNAKLQKIQASVAKETQNTTSQLEEQKKQIDDNFNSLVRLEMETDKDHTVTNKNVQELVVSGTKAKMGIEGDLTDQIDANIKEEYGEKWFSDEGDILPEYIDDYNTKVANRLEEYSNKIASSYEDMVENLEDKDVSKLETIYADAEKNGWNAIDILKQISTQFAGNDDILNAATNQYSEQIKQYNEQLIHIADMVGDSEPTTKDSLGILQSDSNTFTGWFTQLSSATQQAINDGVNKASDFGGEEFGAEFAKQYAKDIQNAISSGQIDEEIYSLFNNAISDENFNIFTIEKTKNQFIKDVEELGYGIEEAEYQWENLYAFSQSYGQIEFGITTTGALEELTEQVESNLDSIVSSYENVSNYISTQMTEGGLNLSEFRKLKEELANIGLDVQNFVAGMQNGLYQIDFTALTQAYHDQVDNEQITVEAVKEQINARIAAIDALLAENTSQVNMQNNVVDTTDALWAQAEAMAQVATMAARAAAAQKGQNPNSVTPFTVTKPKNTVKKIQLTQEQRNNLKQERQHLVDLLKDESALAEIAKQQNAVSAAHAQISNDEAEAINNATKANKGGASAAKDAADATDKLREAQEKLNEALYGTENYKNAADHLANYTERLEELTDKANKAKESLKDLGETDSAKDLLSDYAENVKLENITRTAENQVLQQSMDDLLNILNDKYSEYFQKVGDTWMWNASVVDAQMNDNEKDFLIESIENLNEYQDKIDENLDAIEEREKEFKEMRKTALDSRIALEEEVMDILKEKYQKEIDATQEKYDALKEADDDYLDALEDAINKQRELRDRANEYEDLAQKERKLALKQRDTSGANRKDTLQLQQEVEESRQDMLDNEVDRLLESMKEMYELQQESREAELEYMNAMVENGQLLQEANEIIASFNTREDMLAWFFENNQELADMSVAATEKYKMELEDMYDAAELYYAMSETNLEELTSFTQEEVADTVATIGETLTLEAERSYNEMRETVDKEVEDAKQAVIDAQKAVEDAAASSASAVGGAAGSMTNAAGTTATTAQQTIKTVEDVCTSAINAVIAAANNANNAKVASGNITNFENDVVKGGASVGSYVTGVKAKMKAAELNPVAKQQSISEQLKQAVLQGPTNGQTIYRSVNNKNNSKYENQSNIKYKMVIGSDTYYFTSRNEFLKYKVNAPKGSTYAGSIQNGKRVWNHFKTGGLVDYTGPAWVDGTPSKPEAFLNSDDTKRIGEAAKLLSNLPILNSTSSASTPLSTNIGDTSIEIHINVDSISSDYDVDRLAERIKSDIVDASKPVGTPVILKR